MRDEGFLFPELTSASCYSVTGNCILLQEEIYLEISQYIPAPLHSPLPPLFFIPFPITPLPAPHLFCLAHSKLPFTSSPPSPLPPLSPFFPFPSPFLSSPPPPLLPLPLPLTDTMVWLYSRTLWIGCVTWIHSCLAANCDTWIARVADTHFDSVLHVCTLEHDFIAHFIHASSFTLAKAIQMFWYLRTTSIDWRRQLKGDKTGQWKVAFAAVIVMIVTNWFPSDSVLFKDNSLQKAAELAAEMSLCDVSLTCVA